MGHSKWQTSVEFVVKIRKLLFMFMRSVLYLYTSAPQTSFMRVESQPKQFSSARHYRVVQLLLIFCSLFSLIQNSKIMFYYLSMNSSNLCPSLTYEPVTVCWLFYDKLLLIYCIPLFRNILVSHFLIILLPCGPALPFF